ncbi:hypothetical protein [Azohydromonas aeria]|uniref:hypothetical protein n=1 Tax=Azohydromonas aeria TaxID=2590212 RepID=UPI0012FAB920|nr:hypothetical protein [Azohydromonas aeria]
MPIRQRRGCAAVLAALAALSALPWNAAAQAAEGTAPAAPTPAAAATSPPAASAAPTGLLGLKPVAASLLDTQRGGTQVLNDMKLNGVVADNQAVNVVTGSNTISDGAFANASGLPLVVQNTGNNVLIQNATIVNVQLK